MRQFPNLMVLRITANNKVFYCLPGVSHYESSITSGKPMGCYKPSHSIIQKLNQDVDSGNDVIGLQLRDWHLLSYIVT